jgi:ribosome assembly protein 4
MCRTLEGHAHWVNTLAINTEYVLRTGSIVKPGDDVNPDDSKHFIIVSLKTLSINQFRFI